MTAIYDSILTVSKGGIIPCCRAMDVCAMRRQIYANSKGQMMLRSSEDQRKGMVMIRCPFCGAEALQ